MTIYYIDHDAQSLSCNTAAFLEHDRSLSAELLPSLDEKVGMRPDDFRAIFLTEYGLDYIGEYGHSLPTGARIVTHPTETDTCFEKAEILGSWDPLNIIKVFYLECPNNGMLYAVVVPETGCFINRVHVRRLLNLSKKDYLKKAEELPNNMSFGTCSPFIQDSDIMGQGGRVDKIIFDSDTLSIKKAEQTLDDFSYGLDHRQSIQMNYHDCYSMLKERYPDTVIDTDILQLSFKENLVRTKGKIKIVYEFYTLNYRTAKFINSMHGYGDVSIFNDYVDELYLPDVLTSPD